MLTEERNEKSKQLHEKSIADILQLMNEQDETITEVIKKALPAIVDAVKLMVQALENEGSILYVGAGTSGRLGVLDASECPPTFGVSPDVIKGIIAGGDKALHTAMEDVEDNGGLGGEDVEANVQSKDVVIGITSSGETPYVIGAVKRAKQLGLKTIGIACNDSTKLSHEVDIAIELPVGAEIVTGSTRLKAGTAQKMVLNMLSTTAMVKTGKVYDNLMINLHATNEKLRQRAISIIRELTDTNDWEASTAYHTAKGDTRLAILMIMFDIGRKEANAALEIYQGNFVKAFHKLSRGENKKTE